MKASDFTRYDCQVGRRRIMYKKLLRDYRCQCCGGSLVELPPNTDIPEWHVSCGQCREADFIHERQIKRQQMDALEVRAGLPLELQDLMGFKKPARTPVVFSLSPIEIEI